MPLLRPNDQDPVGVHYAWMHFIVLIWGFTGILGRLISVGALDLVWHRILLAILFLLAYQQFSKNRIQGIPSRKLGLLLCLNGLILMVHWVTFYAAIKLSNVSLTLACLSTGPLFAAFLEPIFFKRHLQWSEVGLGFGVLLGLLMVVGATQGQGLAIAVGLISSVLSALFSVLNGRIVRQMDSTSISFYELLAGFGGLSLYLLLSANLMDTLAAPTTSDWIYIVILASFCTAFAFVQSVRIMRYLSPFTVVLSISMESIYGILLALLIFGSSEAMPPLFYGGFAVVLSMLLVNAWMQRRRRVKLSTS
ncbi:MAG: DMT family transporter [Flavobacteriaceae bacterium]|nr:DMT family transporter [Flavobacteriaceae bacterium]PHX84502.1 MAG: EamA family transporter [Flavobacteriales bacterium]